MLINCVAYEDGRKLADLSVEQISEFVHRPNCFVWVALRDATHDELEKMQAEFSLHDLAVEDARHGHQRPKVEEYGDTLFIVMHTVEYSATDELRVGEVNIFVGRNFVLSVRNHSAQNLLGVRERAEHEPHLLKHGAGFVFYALMDAVVDRYFPIIDALESELEVIEEHIFVRGSARSNIERLYALKRRIGVQLVSRNDSQHAHDCIHIAIRTENGFGMDQPRECGIAAGCLLFTFLPGSRRREVF